MTDAESEDTSFVLGAGDVFPALLKELRRVLFYQPAEGLGFLFTFQFANLTGGDDALVARAELGGKHLGCADDAEAGASVGRQVLKLAALGSGVKADVAIAKDIAEGNAIGFAVGADGAEHAILAAGQELPSFLL